VCAVVELVASLPLVGSFSQSCFLPIGPEILLPGPFSLVLRLVGPFEFVTVGVGRRGLCQCRSWPIY